MRAQTRRFLALAFIGCAFLLIYQVVFMARTSAARDLNHIRSARLTTQQAERFVLHATSRERIEADVAELVRGGGGREPLLLAAVPGAHARALQHPASPFYVRAAGAGGHAVPLSPYSALFRVATAPRRVELGARDVLVMPFHPKIGVDAVVRRAQARGCRAVVYVVPPGWAPRFGAREYAIPVLVTPTMPTLGRARVALEFGRSDSHVVEKTIPGHSSETVLVADSGGSPESLAVFTEMARVYSALQARGWRPYRTVRFVSLPRFAAPAWARSNARWLARHAVAFIDTSAAPGLAASPVLNRTLGWAVASLVDGGLCPAGPVWAPAIDPPDGANTFLFDFQIPSVSAALADPLATARMLNLVLASVALETVVPFVVSDYAPYLNSTAFAAQAAQFDELVEFLKFEFTREYPWYQGMRKLRALAELKRANTRLVQFEQQLSNAEGKHVVFANDRAGAGVRIAPDPSEVSEAVSRILRTGQLQL